MNVAKFMTLSSRIQRLVPPIAVRSFGTSPLNLAHERKLKTKSRNVVTLDALFPQEDIPERLTELEEVTKPLNVIEAVSPSLSATDDHDDDADTFGTMASPEMQSKLRELDNLWPLEGWNDGLEEEAEEQREGGELTKLSKEQSLISSDNSKLPVAAAKENNINDEVLRPSLLYPGDSVKKALSKGPRTSVRVQDGDEPRDHRYYQSKIDKLIGRGYVREALQLYEVGMKLEDQREPDYHLYK